MTGSLGVTGVTSAPEEQPETLWSLFEAEDNLPKPEKPSQASLPHLPYKGTSGHGGNGASRERAMRDDATGQTTRRQQWVLDRLWGAGPRGLTGHELADISGWNSGQTSNALSILHKEGRIARLRDERRNKSGVYVRLEWVGDRATEHRGQHAPKIPPLCPNCGYDLT